MRHNYESADSSQQSIPTNVNFERNTSNVQIICKINKPNRPSKEAKQIKRSSSVSSHESPKFKSNLDVCPAFV